MSKTINLDENNLKHGVMGLVIALTEIIKEALQLQAMKRMESGSLTEDEIERLGETLMDLDSAIDNVKVEIGVTESVRAVRDGPDRIVDEVIDNILNPTRWESKMIGEDGVLDETENSG